MRNKWVTIAMLFVLVFFTFGPSPIANLSVVTAGSLGSNQPGLLRQPAMNLQQASIVEPSKPLTPNVDFPPDPSADIAWSAGTSGVADIVAAFNNARSQDDATLPGITLPSQAAWDAMSEQDRAVYLINRERIDRGILPFFGIETNVQGVAQAYAQFLLDHSVFGHNENGTPFDRMNAIPAIATCNQSEAENIAVRMSSVVAPIALAVEQDVYDWIYNDSGSAWGHRHNVLWESFNNDSGPAGNEGFLGIGRSSGGPYNFSGNWAHAELTVMDDFDPCPTWVYSSTTHSISGNVFDNLAVKLNGVTISAGGTVSTTTNGAGDYTLSGLVDGDYTITPTLTGYTFSPVVRPVHISGADVTLQDFIGTPDGSPASTQGFIPLVSK